MSKLDELGKIHSSVVEILNEYQHVRVELGLEHSDRQGGKQQTGRPSRGAVHGGGWGVETEKQAVVLHVMWYGNRHLSAGQSEAWPG